MIDVYLADQADGDSCNCNILYRTRRRHVRYSRIIHKYNTADVASFCAALRVAQRYKGPDAAAGTNKGEVSGVAVMSEVIFLKRPRQKSPQRSVSV